jgi:hypothetical protein
MSFIRRWLKPETSARIGMRPHHSVELAVGLDTAYARTLEAIANVLGANVYLDDRPGRRIEAGFGLVKSERVRCTFEPLDGSVTRVRIEAFFPAGPSVQQKSAAVDALAQALSCER